MKHVVQIDIVDRTDGTTLSIRIRPYARPMFANVQFHWFHPNGEPYYHGWTDWMDASFKRSATLPELIEMVARAYNDHEDYLVVGEVPL